LPRLLRSSECRNAKRIAAIREVQKNMSDDERNEKRYGGWKKIKRRLEIEFFARMNGITKRQTTELLKKYGEHDYATLVREARWLRE
jgi:hypothetical protein